VEIGVEGVARCPAGVRKDRAGGVIVARISKDVEIGVGEVACCPVVVREDRAGGAVMARI